MAKALLRNQAVTGHTETAIVQGGFGKEFMVHCSSGVVRASVAFSCMVVPESGDKVLINCSSGQNHILSILERQDKDDMTLAFPGNVALKARAGNIELSTANQLSLSSAEKTHLVSADVTLNALKTSIHSEELSVVGDKATSQWREVTSIAGAFNFISDRLTQRIKNSFKTVEGVDQQTSQNLLQTIGKTFSIRSRDAVITARKDVKIDGERIHMG